MFSSASNGPPELHFNNFVRLQQGLLTSKKLVRLLLPCGSRERRRRGVRAVLYVPTWRNGRRTTDYSKVPESARLRFLENVGINEQNTPAKSWRWCHLVTRRKVENKMSSRNGYGGNMTVNEHTYPPGSPSGSEFGSKSYSRLCSASRRSRWPKERETRHEGMLMASK